MSGASATPEPQGHPFDRSAAQPVAADDGLDLWQLLAFLAARWPWLIGLPLLAAAATIAYSYRLAPSFTAVTTVLPPQQSQGAAIASLASLGALAGLGGGTAAPRAPAEQYVAMLQSATMADRIVDAFDLMRLHGHATRSAARGQVWGAVSIGIGKKDGLLAIEVTDGDPQRAADIANRFVAELRSMTNGMAMAEAKRRRQYYEGVLQEARDGLTQAQRALQATGFNASAIKAEPKAAADNYARLQSQLVLADVRLQALRGALTDNAPEVRQQQTTVNALRALVSSSESNARTAALDPPSGNAGSPDFISRYRDFKYHETLFEVYARQYESARADETRESTTIQVVDPATPPEIKSGPRRLAMATNVALIVGMITMLFILLIETIRRKGRTNRPVVSHGIPPSRL